MRAPNVIDRRIVYGTFDGPDLLELLLSKKVMTISKTEARVDARSVEAKLVVVCNCLHC